MVLIQKSLDTFTPESINEYDQPSYSGVAGRPSRLVHRISRPVYDTKIEAYYNKERQENAQTQRERLYSLYCEVTQGLCDRALSEITGLPCSTVSARRNELIKAGRVEWCGTLKDKRSGMRVKAFRAKMPQISTGNKGLFK